jgi:transposase
LKQEQRERIAVLLGEPPTDHGYNTATWTGPLLIEWIQKHYGILYKRAQIYNIIKSLGFTYQKGRGLFPETDTQKQEAFKAGLKKTP